MTFFGGNKARSLRTGRLTPIKNRQEYPPRDFLQVVNNANNCHGLHTRATREKRADRKRNDFKTQVPVKTPPALLSLTPFLFFLAILTTYFNEFTTIYLSQSNT